RQRRGHPTAYLPLQTTTGGRRAAVAKRAGRAATVGKPGRAKPAIAGRGEQMARVLRQPVGGGQNQRAATGQANGPANAGPNSAKCFCSIGGRQPKPSRQSG